MGSGGIAIAAGITSAELVGIATISIYESANLTSNEASVTGTPSPWRPPQWGSASSATDMTYCVTVPGAYSTLLGASSNTSDTADGQELNQSADGSYAMQVNVSANKVPVQQSPTYLVFDGVLRAAHSQPARPTLFPVQSGSNITDHVILDPAVLSLDIIMSDAQQAFATGQWVGNSSKSISCFMVLDTLRAARVPLTVSTRLKTYSNMIIVDVIPEETYRTSSSLRARIEFRQIFVATVSTQSANSARPQTTNSTVTGQTNTQSVPSGITTQNAVDSDTLESQNNIVVPGASNWSSNNVSTLAV